MVQIIIQHFLKETEENNDNSVGDSNLIPPEQEAEIPANAQ
jgi:hypothetical protein